MRGKRIIFVVVTMALSCIGLGAWWWGSNAPYREAKEEVATHLLDPGTAEFRNLFTTGHQGQKRYICGEVNAKNRLGGYVGFRPFVYDREYGSARIEKTVPMDCLSR